MANPTIKASANIAILWGTKSALSNGANTPTTTLLGAILETLTVTPKNSDPIDIEDGDGLAAIQVMVTDGFNAKATAVYDSNKSMPTPGANVTIVAPKADGNNGTTSLNATFWSWGFTRARKKEKLIEFTITNRPNIDT
jgi:hypothetical protein